MMQCVSDEYNLRTFLLSNISFCLGDEKRRKKMPTHFQGENIFHSNLHCHSKTTWDDTEILSLFGEKFNIIQVWNMGEFMHTYLGKEEV